MAEKMTLVDIQFDVSKVGAGFDELIEKSAKLAVEQARLKKASQDYANQVKELDKALKANTKTQEEYDSEISAIATSQAELRASTTALNQKIAENNAAIKSNITVSEAQGDTIKAMRARLAEVSRQWANMTEEQIHNTETGQRLNAEKRNLTDTLKRLEKQTGDTRRNVGNYADGMAEAIVQTKGATGGIGGLASGLAASIPAVKGFNAVLAMNPIMLVVTAVTTLIGWFTKMVSSSDSASREISKAFAGINTIIKIFSRNAVKPIAMVAKAIGSIVNAAIDAAEWLGIISEETAEAADTAARLADVERENYELETKRLPQIKRLSIELEKLKNMEADYTKTDEERLAAGKKALEVIAEQERLSVDLAKRKYEEAKARAALADATAEERRAVSTLLTELYDVQQDYEGKKAEMISATTGYIKDMQDEQAEAAQAASEAEVEAAQEAADRIAAINEAAHNNKVASLENQITATELAYRRMAAEGTLTAEQEEEREKSIASAKMDILSEQLESNKITFAEYQLGMETIDVEAAERKRAREDEQKAADAERMALEKEQAHEARMMEAESEFEQKQIDLERARMAEVEAAEKSGGDINAINKKYAKLNEQIEKAEYRAKISMAGDLAGQLASLLGEETVAGKVAAVAQATINTYLGATKALAQGGIFGVAQAAVVIATGLANVAKIVSVKSEVDEPKEPKAKYARGGAIKSGTFGGRSHASGGTRLRGSDGTDVEVEAGENFYILNRRASAQINALSALNEAYGGVSFGSTSLTKFADGGQVGLSRASATALSDNDLNRLASAIVSGVASLPTPVVSVLDIDLSLSQLNENRNIALN